MEELFDELLDISRLDAGVVRARMEAFELADRIFLLDKGRIIQEGTPDDLLFRPAGLTRSREVPWPFVRRGAKPAGEPAEHAQPAE